MSQATKSPLPDDLQKKIESHETLLADLDDMIDILQNELMQVQEDNERLRSEIELQNQTISRLENRVADIDERTDLLNIVEKADETDGQQRSAALLQHLKRQAERQGDRGRSSKASANHKETIEALHYPDVHRTTIYHDWDRCVRWIGNESICWTEERNGEKRLFLDLEGVEKEVISHATFQKGETP